MKSNKRKRRLVEMQGYVDLNDRQVRHVDRWSRLAPAMSAAWVAAGLMFQSAAVLWAVVPVAMLGAGMRYHPFDLIYNYAVRPVIGGRALPPHGASRRFASGAAAVLIAVVATLFALGAATAGTILGVLLLALPVTVISTGFCVASFVFHIAVAPLLGGPAGWTLSTTCEIEGR